MTPTFETCSVELGEPSDGWLADNRLTREQWEAMVQREAAKMQRQRPQPDLFA